MSIIETNHKILFRDDDELYELINSEINKKFTFKTLCKNFDSEDISEDLKFDQEQCFFMCCEEISSIKKCNNNSIENLILKSKQIKKYKILKKTLIDNNEITKVSIATTNIKGVETKIVIKEFEDKYEMLYEMFIANLLKKDPIIEQHICGCYGKQKSNKLLLEYIDGKPITDIRNLNMKEFSDIISQLFMILDYSYRKYGFLHGDLHLDNFLILHNPIDKFDINLKLSNGKEIKYKSDYKIVLIDYGLSHLKYKFYTSNGNYEKILMKPLSDENLGFDYSIPLVDITKFLVFFVHDVLYENKHKKLTEVDTYIVNFIQYLYSIIGKPDKVINTNFFDKCIDKYGYIYDLINSNLDLSFEDLYIKFVIGTRMDIHDISEYLKNDIKKSHKHENEDLQIIYEIAMNICNENLILNDKMNKIVSFLKDLEEMKIGKKELSVSKEHFKYIYINLYNYICRYEINKNIFENEDQMIEIVNKVFNIFTKYNIPLQIPENQKYEIVENIVEFKMDKFVDCFLKKTNLKNILKKYDEIFKIANKQIKDLDSLKINKKFKNILIKIYKKLPIKILQKNYIENEIDIKMFNCVEKIKFISHIVYILNKQFLKTVNSNVDLHKHNIHLFFHRFYKHCEKISKDIVENAKYALIDWVSYNRIIMYDFYIRSLSLMCLSDNFIKTYISFLEYEDEIWEKIYKKKDFNNLANTISLSENMLKILTNRDFDSLIDKINSVKNIDNLLNINNEKIEKFTLGNSVINNIFKSFHKMYTN